MSDRLPLLLLPGLLCDHDLWASVLTGLSDQAQMTVADLTRDDSVSAMAARVLDEAPTGRFALAGLSMGGYVAQEIMRQAPERVIGLALLDTSARPDSDDQKLRRRALIDLAGRGRFKGVTPKLLPMLIHERRLSDDALTGRIMAMAERVGQAAFVRQQEAIIGRVDGRGDLSRIACPTLVVCGRDDALTPLPLAEEMAAAIPGAMLRVVEDCGHLPPMEKPDEAVTVLADWLDRLTF
ncbi:alpha/beta hydrolase [Tistrella sp. BH-R2-4]|jgi:pimeloyl-ACP methyl ester carboxylesterase|uniref:Alpha/beta hydrolase n=1 Tax=Tistrella arctica TaxID=3133430 RepID=A0ABU9YHS7_9PROT